MNICTHTSCVCTHTYTVCTHTYTRVGLVVQQHAALDQGVRSAAEELVLVDGVLASQQRDVGPQRHFAQAVGVEVELVLHNVSEVLLDACKVLESAAMVASALVALR